MEETRLILPTSVSPVLIPGRKRSGLPPAVSATSTSSHRRRSCRKHSIPAAATPIGLNLPTAASPEPSTSAAASPEPSTSAVAPAEPSTPAAVIKLSVLEAARAEFPTFTVAVSTYLTSGTAHLFFLEQAREEQKRCTVLNDLLSRLMDSPSLWKQKLKVLGQLKCWIMEWGNFFQSTFTVEILETERQRIIQENSSSDSVLAPAAARSTEPHHAAKALDSQRAPKPLDSQHAAKPLDSQHAAKPLDSQHAAKPLDSQHAAKPLDSQHAAKPLDSQHATKPLDSQHAAKPLDSQHAAKPLDSQHATKPLDSQHAAKPLDSQHAAKPLDSQHAAKSPETQHAAKLLDSANQTDCAPGQMDCAPGQTDCAPGQTNWDHGLCFGHD
ncbi:hypothetical protein CRENBAI_011049 [Crenichthys baileyi]|uniref:Uncharacterized protein n=1 Tax=Crenichthys baileyi TaxID=28760 RepID=A0AAV9R9A8_9TELE